jgi:hypothetical protein
MTDNEQGMEMGGELGSLCGMISAHYLRCGNHFVVSTVRHIKFGYTGHILKHF